jgi:hypothetical protein
MKTNPLCRHGVESAKVQCHDCAREGYARIYGAAPAAKEDGIPEEPRKPTRPLTGYQGAKGEWHYELEQSYYLARDVDPYLAYVEHRITELRIELKECQVEACETTKLCHKYQNQLWAADKSVASLQEPEGELPPLDVTDNEFPGMSLQGQLGCRERQLLAALSELRKLRSQESK